MSREKEEQDRLRDICHAINERLPEGHGFIVLTFETGPGGILRYASNCQRSDCINALKEFLIKAGAAEDWMQHIR